LARSAWIADAEVGGIVEDDAMGRKIEWVFGEDWEHATERLIESERYTSCHDHASQITHHSAVLRFSRLRVRFNRVAEGRSGTPGVVSGKPDIIV
jgi:hypothetical protein